MYNNRPIVYKKERRQKPDIVCQWLEIAAVLVWIVLFCAILFYQNAQPQAETFLDRYFDLTLRKTWDYHQMNVVFYLLLLLFVLSAFSLILNFKRLKRNTDRIRISFIISLAGSVVGIILYIFVF